MLWKRIVWQAIAAPLVATAIFCLIAWPSFSAVSFNQFVTPQTPTLGVATFVQGTDAAGTFKTVYTGATNGSKCVAMVENNADQTATHVIMIRIVHTAVNYVIATATTTTSSATLVFGATLDLMAAANWAGLPRDAAGNPYVFLGNGDTLQATFNTALTARLKSRSALSP
jgi:hypothetical protein